MHFLLKFWQTSWIEMIKREHKGNVWLPGSLFWKDNCRFAIEICLKLALKMTKNPKLTIF